MNRLRKQFILFFLLLSGSLILLLSYSFSQINSEEVRLWQELTENAFNRMQSHISDFLIKEDQRSFSEYRYYYVPESQAQGYALNVSPLSEIPQNDPKGLIGYFQIDPSGKLNSPYLPPEKDQSKLKDLEVRIQLESQLKKTTQSLINDIKSNFASNSNNDFIELGTLAKPKVVATNFLGLTSSAGSSTNSITAPSPSISEGDGRSQKDQKNSKLAKSKKQSISRNLIYPNPLLKNDSMKGSGIGSSSIDSEDELDDLASGEKDADQYAQKTVSNAVQYQTFTEQKVLDFDVSAGLYQSEDKILNTSVPAVLTDPFRARLVNMDHLIFYRRTWIDQKLYIQGFVVKLKTFYDWAIQTSYQSTKLPEFTDAILNWETKTLASSTFDKSPHSKTLFARNLGYPLNQFQWKVMYNKLPPTQSRNLLYILTFLLGFLATVGIYIIYRSAAIEVQLSQKRQDFVSAVSHELKTPLTSIRMYSEMLKEGWVEDETKKQEYYQLMASEGDRLTKLIDNVLHLARLEKKNYRFDLKSQSPVDDFTRIAKEFQTILQNTGFEFTYSLASKIAPITYDPDAIKQILLTALENSLKFSQKSQHKKIHLDLSQLDNKVSWSLTDSGPGVDNKELKKIFGKFYRVEDELTRQTKGTGIGLAMAKMLADGMGAEIKAENGITGGLKVSLVFKSSSFS